LSVEETCEREGTINTVAKGGLAVDFFIENRRVYAGCKASRVTINSKTRSESDDEQRQMKKGAL